MEKNYQDYKKRRLKKRIIFIFIGLFVVLNLYIVFTPFKRIYLVSHAYPEAKKWEFMAMVIRKYGYYVARYTPLDERDWLIKQFIILDHKLLDEAAKYISNDDLEKHLKIWYLFESYQGWHQSIGHLHAGGFYTIEETRIIVDDLWQQLENIMTLETRGLFYKVEKFKVWVMLSYIYIYSISAHWEVELNKYDYQKYINDRKNLERLMKIYNYNEYIFQHYKENFPKVYKAYSDKGFDIRTKHLMTSHLIPYLLKNRKEYIKGKFCDFKTNQYFKGYIDSRNELLSMRSDPNEDVESLERIIGKYREKLINRTCRNIKLIRGVEYVHNN